MLISFSTLILSFLTLLAPEASLEVNAFSCNRENESAVLETISVMPSATAARKSIFLLIASKIIFCEPPVGLAILKILKSKGTWDCDETTVLLFMKKYFIENKEAVYFSSPNECVKKCKYYLKNTKQAKKIAKNGNIKVKKILKANNDHLINKIISVAFN